MVNCKIVLCINYSFLMFYDWNIWNVYVFFILIVLNGELNIFFIDKNIGKILFMEFLDFEII